MSERAKLALTDKHGWVFGVIAGLLIWSWFYAQTPPLASKDNYDTPSIVFVDEPFKICREVEYFRDTTMRLDRVMIQNNLTKDRYPVSLGSIYITREEGEYNICRNIVIPKDIKTGNWTILTYITYTTFIWTNTMQVKPIPVKVINEYL